MTEDLPSSVCLRVTRACNARCGFCLAPPTGHGVSYEAIVHRLEWLASVGVRKVNLSGGEPTIRSDLADIVDRVRELGLVCAMTTNGIRLPDALLDRLALADVKVKVSLHGPKELHDAMLGIACFGDVDRNIGRLLDAGIRLAIQTVVTRIEPRVHEWMIEYCLDRGVKKLRFVPFVPRGRGLLTSDSYQLEPEERDRVLQAIGDARDEHIGRLDIGVLDFWTRDYYVVETNGSLQIQRETDQSDSTVADLDGVP